MLAQRILWNMWWVKQISRQKTSGMCQIISMQLRKWMCNPAFCHRMFSRASTTYRERLTHPPQLFLWKQWRTKTRFKMSWTACKISVPYRYLSSVFTFLLIIFVSNCCRRLALVIIAAVMLFLAFIGFRKSSSYMHKQILRDYYWLYLAELNLPIIVIVISYSSLYLWTAVPCIYVSELILMFCFTLVPLYAEKFVVIINL